MKKLLCSLAFTLLASNTTMASVLTFDDIPGGSVQNSVADVGTYGGFTFSSTLDWVDLVNSYWSYGAHSGDFALLNNNYGVGIIKSADNSDFSFDGLWAKKWATGIESGGAPSLFGTITGWNNGAQVWNINTSLNGSYQFFAGQSQMIDELRLGLGNNFLVDDLALNQRTQSSVPEPTPLILLGLGLIGLGLSRRKNKAQ